jgi:hypothetical protein
MKEIFEHKDVSSDIHNWIELIFGHKQKGEEAVKEKNLYPSITYENGVDLTNPENLEIKDSLTVQLFNYGQCPNQLFTHPHAKREPKQFSVKLLDA